MFTVSCHLSCAVFHRPVNPMVKKRKNKQSRNIINHQAQTIHRWRVHTTAMS